MAVITALFIVTSTVASYMPGGYITGSMPRPAETASRDELTVRDGLNRFYYSSVEFQVAQKQLEARLKQQYNPLARTLATPLRVPIS